LNDDFLEDSARRFLDHIEDCIRGALSPEASPVLAPENKRELERALYRLRPSFDELAKGFIDPLRETKPNRAMYGYEKLWEFMDAVFVGGSRGVVTDSGKNYFAAERRRIMRAKRERPEILDAIVAVRGDGPVEHPSSTAVKIYDRVNTWLESHGRADASEDAIYRRLRKLPRS
jgi:hypothetical protein